MSKEKMLKEKYLILPSGRWNKNIEEINEGEKELALSLDIEYKITPEDKSTIKEIIPMEGSVESEGETERRIEHLKGDVYICDEGKYIINEAYQFYFAGLKGTSNKSISIEYKDGKVKFDVLKEKYSHILEDDNGKVISKLDTFYDKDNIDDSYMEVYFKDTK